MRGEENVEPTMVLFTPWHPDSLLPEQWREGTLGPRDGEGGSASLDKAFQRLELPRAHVDLDVAEQSFVAARHRRVQKCDAVAFASATDDAATERHEGWVC